tara:strand:+ start:3326 stop:3538 length:213 start_codon:yes stop_codon:yes gene_type:complete
MAELLGELEYYKKEKELLDIRMKTYREESLDSQYAPTKRDILLKQLFIIVESQENEILRLRKIIQKNKKI